MIKNEVASAVFTSKSILAVFSFLILIILIFFIPSFYKNKFLLLIVFSQVISTIIYPTWYFQGIQKMKILTYIQLTMRILSLPLTFIFIKSSSPHSIMKLNVGLQLFFTFRKRNLAIFIVMWVIAIAIPGIASGVMTSQMSQTSNPITHQL